MGSIKSGKKLTNGGPIFSYVQEDEAIAKGSKKKKRRMKQTILRCSYLILYACATTIKRYFRSCLLVSGGMRDTRVQVRDYVL
mmetsp:Transcript_500/g.786  ORF Transcript_500/g.786 Transcript_500/m.786 type:complete len:83 (-) Transcript_500:903-1151(-)